MNPIGGYFELELQKGEEYFQEALRLNSGRNAFEYLLRARNYKKVYLPYFTCDVMLEPIIKLKIECEYYHINEMLDPVFDFNRIGKNETFIYTNYFGIKRRTVKILSKSCPNLIIDNSQAFFEKPDVGIDTFNSPRKFFGIPDGAYLFTDKLLEVKFPYDNSTNRFSHLIKRIDEGAESGYSDFLANNDTLKGQPIKVMSSLTQALLKNVDFRKISEKRRENFKFLNKHLQKTNQLVILDYEDFVPMVYPYYINNGEIIKRRLIKEKVFVATYWPNVFKWCNEDFVEYKLTQNIIPLPIDQRYDINKLLTIIKLLE